MRDKKKIKNYVIWGAVAAVVNIGMFQFLMLLGMDYKVANLLAVLFNRCFTYVTNKLFVFKTRCRNNTELAKEMLSFFMARMATLVLDFAGVYLLVEFLGMEALVSKIITAGAVIATNYILSDLLVFNKGKKE